MDSESGALPRKALLEVLEASKPWRRPVWLMRQAGRYLPEYRQTRKAAGSFLELCYSPELAAEVTLQPLRRFDLDAAIVFADILLQPQALGCELSFRENEGPALSPVSSADAVGRLQQDGFLERLGPVFETLQRVNGALAPHVALIGFCGAPWTVASYMVEGGSSGDRGLARRAAYAREAWFEALIELLTETACEYLARQFEAGADVVQVFDSWAGDLDDDARGHYCERPMRRIVEGLQARGWTRPVIGFARGIGAAHREFADATGVSAVSVEWSVPVKFMAEELVPRTPVQGNLDPVLLALGGSALRHGVEHLAGSMPVHRHIFNLGHGIRPDTALEHVADMVAHIRAVDARSA